MAGSERRNQTGHLPLSEGVLNQLSHLPTCWEEGHSLNKSFSSNRTQQQQQGEMVVPKEDDTFGTEAFTYWGKEGWKQTSRKCKIPSGCSSWGKMIQWGKNGETCYGNSNATAQWAADRKASIVGRKLGLKLEMFARLYQLMGQPTIPLHVISHFLLSGWDCSQNFTRNAAENMSNIDDSSNAKWLNYYAMWIRIVKLDKREQNLHQLWGWSMSVCWQVIDSSVMANWSR